MRINVIGPIFGTTGYDSHCRGLINSLYKVSDVKLSTQLFQGWERLVNDAELDMITKPNKENDTNLIITTPHNWKLFLGTGINIGYCVWEGSKVPVSYIDEMLNPKIDYIFVPSEHTRDAIINTWDTSGYDNTQGDKYQDLYDKIKVIPHGVDFSLFKSLEKKHDKFTFICNKGWRGTSWDRGGVQYLLKAFNEEFSKEDKVQLLIKLNQAYINPQVLQQSILNLKLMGDRAEFKIFMDSVPQNKLWEFYNMGDTYICPTRSEAFDLGSAEAMACGLPVVATGFGGQIEHMNKENSLLCDYKLEVVKDDIMYEGIEWANIDIQDLRKKMRWCYEHQDEVKKMGEKALEFIKDFTWDNSAKQILGILSSS